MAGTTPTFSVVFSAGPKFVGRLLTMVSAPLPPPEEQPAASAATVVIAAATAAVRLHLPMPAKMAHLTELAAEQPMPRKDKPVSNIKVVELRKMGPLTSGVTSVPPSNIASGPETRRRPPRASGRAGDGSYGGYL